jgi:cytoskeletal protein RodZ
MKQDRTIVAAIIGGIFVIIAAVIGVFAASPGNANSNNVNVSVNSNNASSNNASSNNASSNNTSSNNTSSNNTNSNNTNSNNTTGNGNVIVNGDNKGSIRIDNNINNSAEIPD